MDRPTCKLEYKLESRREENHCYSYVTVIIHACMHSKSRSFVWALHPCCNFGDIKLFLFQKPASSIWWHDLRDSRLCEWTRPWCRPSRGAFLLESTRRHVWPTGRVCLFLFFFFILLLLDACVCLSVYCVLQSGGHVLGSAGYCSPVTRFCWYWTYPVMGTHYSMLDASMEWERILEKLPILYFIYTVRVLPSSLQL